jgi:hypothetical protein
LLNQIEEDIGSAEEQPISNRFDTHTKNEGSVNLPFFIHFLVCSMAKKPMIQFDFDTILKIFFGLLDLILYGYLVNSLKTNSIDF